MYVLSRVACIHKDDDECYCTLSPAGVRQSQLNVKSTNAEFNKVTYMYYTIIVPSSSSMGNCSYLKMLLRKLTTLIGGWCIATVLNPGRSLK